MLEYFRNAAKSWVAKILLGLLVLSFAVWGINDIFFSGLWSQDLATVGNQKVSGPQYAQQLNRAIDNYSRQFGTKLSNADARKLGLDKQVRDGLLSTAALDSLASDMRITYGQEQVASEIAANPMFHDSNGKFDRDAFFRLLANNGLNEQTFVASEQAAKIRSALTSAAELDHAPKVILDAQNQFRGEQRRARYVRFSVNEADVAAPTDAELKTYFDAHASNYVDPEYRAIAIMKVEPQDIAAKLDVSDLDITDSYDKNKLDYFTPEQRTILQLSFPDEAAAAKARQRLEAGEEFAKIATEMGAKASDITLANKTKADIFDSAIADAAFSLPVGTISAPVKGGLTIALLKVTEIKPAKQLPLADVRDQLKSRIQVERARDEIQSVYDAVEDARASQTKFEDIAAKAGIPFTFVPAVSATGFDKAGKQVLLPSSDDLLKAAYGSDVGLDNDAVTLPDGYIWYDVREVIPSAPQKLEAVKAIVTADWKAKELRTAAEAKALALVAKVKGGATLEMLATELATAVKETKSVKRNDGLEDFDSSAVKVLFSQPQNSVGYALEGDGVSAKLIETSAIEAAPPATSETTTAATDDMRGALTRDMVEVYLSAIKGNTAIWVNDELWQRLDSSNTQTP